MLLSPANGTFLRPWAQTYDQSTAGERIADSQLGHFHWGLRTGILPAVCQRLRACARWARTAAQPARTWVTHLPPDAAVCSLALIYPGGSHFRTRTQAISPLKEHLWETRTCFEMKQRLSHACHRCDVIPSGKGTRMSIASTVQKMQELKLTCLRLCENMVIIKKYNYHYKVNSSLSSYKQVFNLHQKFTFQISSQPRTATSLAEESRQWLAGSARLGGRSTVASRECRGWTVTSKPQVHAGKPIRLL